MLDVLVLIVPVAVFSIVVSYYDWKKGVIPNELILALLALGILVQIYLGNLVEHPLQVLGIFTYGAVLSFVLWFLGLISPGDSKLFTVLFLYFPIGQYTNSLPLDFLINIFVPVFILLVLYLLIKSDRDIVMESLVTSFSPYRVLMVLVILTGFSWFVFTLFSLFGVDIGYFGLVLALFLGYELLTRFSSGKTEIVLIALALARIVVDYRNALTLRFITHMLLLTLFFVTVRLFILKISFDFFSESKNIEDLEEGDVLSEGIVEEDYGYRKVDLLNFSLIGYMEDRKRRFVHNLGALSSEDLEEISKLGEEGKLDFEEIEVHRTQRFAMFIFLGYFLTVFLGTNFATFIRTLV